MKNLKLLREEKQLSQQKLGNHLLLSQQSINNYENGINEPDISTLIKIADFFETSVDFLIGHTTIWQPVQSVEKYELNESEAIYMDNYRKLPRKFRSSVDNLINDILSK